jgi:hypothetical protein
VTVVGLGTLLRGTRHQWGLKGYSEGGRGGWAVVCATRGPSLEARPRNPYRRKSPACRPTLPKMDSHVHCFHPPANPDGPGGGFCRMFGSGTIAANACRPSSGEDSISTRSSSLPVGRPHGSASCGAPLSQTRLRQPIKHHVSGRPDDDLTSTPRITMCGSRFIIDTPGPGHALRRRPPERMQSRGTGWELHRKTGMPRDPTVWCSAWNGSTSGTPQPL